MLATKKRGLLAVLALCAAGAPLSAQRIYTLKDLGPLPTGQKAETYAINEVGQAVGMSVGPSQVTQRAVRWDFGASSPTDLDVFQPSCAQYYSAARGLNDSGDVVGEGAYSWNGCNGFTIQGFLYSGGGMTRLYAIGVPNGGSSAHDVSNAGLAVGQAPAVGQLPTAVVWNTGGSGAWNATPTFLDPFPGTTGQPSKALAVNEQGWVVGHAWLQDTDTNFRHHSALWKPAPTKSDPDAYAPPLDLGNFGSIPGYSQAHDINDLNSVVGEAAFSGIGIRPHAFVWDEVNGLIDLSTLTGGTHQSVAKGINNFGEIVGCSAPTGTADGRAVIWKNNVIHDLNDMLLWPWRDWELMSAEAINDQGDIVGYGCPPGSSEIHGFLLSTFRLPKPGIIMLPPHVPPLPIIPYQLP